MTFVIDKGIPAPPPSRGRGAGTGFPFKEMEVGDSFYVEVDPSPEAETASKLLVRRVRQAALGANRKADKTGEGAKFTVRKVDGGVRVWRTA
jgi:hypothetical protein